jgi:hypothetical protein
MTKSRLISGAVLCGALALGGCSKHEAPMAARVEPATAPAPPMPGPGGASTPSSGAAANAGTPANAGPAQPLPATSRKVIRSAELSLEVESPARAEEKVSQLVERLGGYVASSSHELAPGSEPRANLSLRIPVNRLEEALRELKQLSVGLPNEKLGSEDVTDEYIDLGAHVTNQMALEKQLTTLLAQATSVEQAIKVHHEIAVVRTEIDRLQGRLRFLESESALAKVTVTLLPKPTPPQIVAVTPVTFLSRLGDAMSESIATAREISTGAVLFCVYALGVLAPLGVLLGLPLWGLVHWLRRRQRRLAALAS